MADAEADETCPLIVKEENGKKPGSSRTCLVIVAVHCVLLLAVFFVAGLLVGYYVLGDNNGPCLGPGVPKEIIEDADPTISKKIIGGIKANNIRDNLKQLTQDPHLAGTPADEQVLAEVVSDTWTQQGFDYVDSMSYDVLLSYPNKTTPNQVHILDESGTPTFSSATKEDILIPEQNKSDVVQPCAAYSATGTAQGDLVYVNYGRLEDFKLLTEVYNVSVEGRIAMVRYGQGFRGDKAELAERYKAIGLIVFSDPADTTDLEDPDNVFPNSWWLPPSGVQRGQYRAEKGDPLTPGYPSIESAYRVPEDKAVLPKIPIQPISYRDAKHFLEIMGGDEVPESWRGGIGGITYRFGPGFDQNHAGWKAKLDVYTSNQRVNTTDVMGVIRGNVEPDRYVILGNHRDAFVFGGIDPSSGTAVMLELTRVITNLVKDGWRPKRSLIFCSWGSEEMGLVGSYEWVEEFIKVLGGRTVVYLNLDSAASGGVYNPVKGVPLLFDAVFEAAQKVPTPNKAGETLYDEWLEVSPEIIDGKKTGRPLVGRLVESTDEISFIAEAGICAVTFEYMSSPNLNISEYPVYHSAYDTFLLFDKYIDPGFKHTRAIGQLWGELARNIADSLLLPFNASTYARELHQYVQLLEKDFGDVLQDHDVSLDMLYDATDDFIQSASEFHSRRDRINRKNPIEVRQYNDQLMLLEQAFLDPQGLPDHPMYSRHVLYSPLLLSFDSGNSFPGLVDLLLDIDRSPDPEGQWEKVKRHLATIIFSVKSAAAMLQDVGKLSR